MDLLADPDPAVHGPAAVAWSSWEGATVTLLEDPSLIEDFAEPTYALTFARIENHYFRNAGWFSEGQLIRNAHKLANVPGVIVQAGTTPPVTAWDRHKAWPSAKLVMMPDAGHAYNEPGILTALLATTDKFRQ